MSLGSFFVRRFPRGHIAVVVSQSGFRKGIDYVDVPKKDKEAPRGEDQQRELKGLLL